MLTPDQELHVSSILQDFKDRMEAKYQKGQIEHGGDLWKKKGLIDMAIDEAIDQVVYLLTIKKQLKDAGVDLGEIVE